MICKTSIQRVDARLAGGYAVIITVWLLMALWG